MDERIGVAMKAVVLLSGGLDSTLALKMIADQGIETTALHFSSPFCRCDGKKGCGGNARKASEFSGASLRSIALGEDYLEIVRNPQYGRGKNLNPCIDCRILKFSQAKKIMEEEGASFVVTGEVLGQRPMSQRKNAMNQIERESALTGMIVRPLSAKVMPPSIPEEKGWVDRDKLLAFTGRSRKPQIALASKLGIKDYPCPAGGCLLTDSNFSRRLKDLMEYSEVNIDEVSLLKVGRHFRLSPGYKLVIGRNESEIFSIQ
jgi:tRNA U34 2-thiouridine synthase MnmA/TrmU